MKRMESDYASAEKQLSFILDKSHISFSDFAIEALPKNCATVVIFSFGLSPVKPDSTYSNVKVDLTYNQVTPSEMPEEDRIDQKKEFIFLSPIADTDWTYNLMVKVWGDRYPSTVAICKEDKTAYFVSLTETSMLFYRFCTFTDSEMEQLENLNYSQPYKISITKQALWLAANELEGVRCLRENLQLVLDCGIPMYKTCNV